LAFGIRVYSNTEYEGRAMAPTRTTPADMRAVAIEDLAAALGAVGFQVDGIDRTSIAARFDGSDVELEVVPVAYATGARVAELIDEPRPAGRIPVVVADRVTADAKHRLNEAGWAWLDRRGHLHVRGPGVLVDTVVGPSERHSRTADEPIRGRAGLAVAYRLLTHPTDSISPTGSALGFAPSTISDAVARLRQAGLVGRDGRPVVPELFWALEDRWVPARTWLAEEPVPAGDVHGWCVSGTVAAAELGAPVVSSGATPDLYVPGPAAVTIAARRFGTARDATLASASIAVAPVTAVTDEPRRSTTGGWPVAHPVAVALDLARDRGRGREIVDDWSPPERVW
jgi:hypothetical protein